MKQTSRFAYGHNKWQSWNWKQSLSDFSVIANYLSISCPTAFRDDHKDDTLLLWYLSARRVMRAIEMR